MRNKKSKINPPLEEALDKSIMQPHMGQVMNQTKIAFILVYVPFEYLFFTRAFS